MRTRTATMKCLPLAALLGLAACNNVQRLGEIGSPPQMTPSSDPTADKNYQPMSLPMPHHESAPAEPNALWRTGSRAFFKDQRAAQIGDLITVLVNISDTANMQNQTTAKRDGSEQMGIPNFFGAESLLPRVFTKAIDPKNLVSTSSTNAANGNGQIKRNEVVTLRLAGVITQVMTNGNLVVAARQEVRVNGELRQLAVSGVIRPQDIASDNTVAHDRMAEARIAYGGRGQLSDVQSPRYGQQVMDMLLPF